MPITLLPISRRRFLSASVAATAALLTGCAHQMRAQKSIDPNRFALLSDTHVHADPAQVHSSGTAPWVNFQRISQQVCDLNTRPASVMVCGDCVYLQGRSQDYATLIKALAPMRESGLPIHLTLGNHDNRENFWKALPADTYRQAELDDRQINIIPTPLANWYQLDSLKITDKTPGLLGQTQLEWLAKSLDAHADKPALLMLHHDFGVKPNTDATGLEDAKALLDVILPRKQVKACIYGHTHIWQHTKIDELHLVNLPATAWVFKKTEPNGWVEANLRNNGANFRLYALDAKHPKNGQEFDLAWRA